jgi:hypothetical protein
MKKAYTESASTSHLSGMNNGGICLAKQKFYHKREILQNQGTTGDQKRYPFF